MDKEFPQRIREGREKQGWSAQTLGNKIGVHSSYIEKIEEGIRIPKPEVARRLALVLEQPEQEFLAWSQTRNEPKPINFPPSYPRYPEAREALIGLCEEPESARPLFSHSAMGPLEAALYGLLIDRMARQMGDMGFWGFLPPNETEPVATPRGRLLLEAFFEMLTHPEGETTDYTNVFGGLISSWLYLPPHKIRVTDPDENATDYRLALVDSEGSIIPALEPEDPFYALYRMLTPSQRSDIADITHVLLRSEDRLEVQSALEALRRWHHRDG